MPEASDPLPLEFSCEQPNLGARNRTLPLEKQQELLAAEPSRQSFNILYFLGGGGTCL